MEPLITRTRLLTPLVLLIGIVVVLEELFWRAGMWIGSWVARLPLARLFERLIVALPPWAALCAFVLPGLLLIPVKLLALVAIANGHAATGVTTFVLAKLGGAALVARIYTLSLPKLLTLAWFARWHAPVIAFKTRYLERMRATQFWRRACLMLDDARRSARHAARQLRRACSRTGGQGQSYMLRVLRRFMSIRRARRR
ncbi:MAG: hypothetical protein M3Y65_02890 [Pseudomonadota bacterium]|nr:hypothetical protein [Pseudomonadota bacterium]